MADVFLSYATKNRDFVEKIKNDLEKNTKYSIWMDNHRLRGGQNFVQQLDYNVRNCKIFVVTVTEESNKSNWVLRECLVAEDLKKPRIPLLLNSSLPFHLVGIQYIDFHHDNLYQNGLKHLLEVLKDYLPSSIDNETATSIISDSSLRDTGRIMAEAESNSSLYMDTVDRSLPEAMTTTSSVVVSAVGNFIGKLWQAKKGNSKACKVCMHCQKSRSKQRMIRTRNNAEAKYARNSSEAAKVNNSSPSYNDVDPDQAKEAIKKLLFCVPNGWVEGLLPSEAEVEAAKDFLCRASMRVRQTEVGQEAAGLSSFLESVLTYLDLSNRHYRSRIIEKVSGKIVLKLRVANKDIGPLDFTPDSQTFKLLSKGIDNLYRFLLEHEGEYNPIEVFAGGSWVGSLYILFHAPESMIRALTRFWIDSNEEISLEGSDMVLIGLYPLFLASSSSPQQQQQQPRKNSNSQESGIDFDNLNDHHSFSRLSKTLDSILSGLSVHDPQYFFQEGEAEEECDWTPSDFTAYKNDDGDDFTFLIPGSNDCLKSLLENDEKYWFPMEHIISTTAKTTVSMLGDSTAKARMHHSPFSDESGIPMFGRNGTALSSEERAAIAKRRGLCVRCGTQTHHVKLLGRTPITNVDVFQGICIRCNSDAVPANILAEWQSRNATTAPAGPVGGVGRFRAAGHGVRIAAQQQRPAPGRHGHPPPDHLSHSHRGPPSD